MSYKGFERNHTVMRRHTSFLSGYNQIAEQYMKDLDLPKWYRALSDVQLAAADKLLNSIRDDIEQHTAHRIHGLLGDLGVRPVPKEPSLKKLIKISRGNDVAFLFFLYLTYYQTESKEKYSETGILLLSTIAHLDMVTTLRGLDELLPPPQPPKLPKKEPRKKVIDKEEQKFQRELRARMVDEKYKKFSPYYTPLVKPKLYGRSCVVKEPYTTISLGPYDKWKDKRYIVPNENNRWFVYFTFASLQRRSTAAHLKMVQALKNQAYRHLSATGGLHEKDQFEPWYATFDPKTDIKSSLVAKAELRNLLRKDIFDTLPLMKKKALCKSHEYLKELEKQMRMQMRVEARDRFLKYFDVDSKAKEARMKRIREELDAEISRIECEFRARAQKMRQEALVKIVNGANNIEVHIDQLRDIICTEEDCGQYERTDRMTDVHSRMAKMCETEEDVCMRPYPHTQYPWSKPAGAPRTRGGSDGDHHTSGGEGERDQRWDAARMWIMGSKNRERLKAGQCECGDVGDIDSFSYSQSQSQSQSRSRSQSRSSSVRSNKRERMAGGTHDRALTTTNDHRGSLGHVMSSTHVRAKGRTSIGEELLADLEMKHQFRTSKARCCDAHKHKPGDSCPCTGDACLRVSRKSVDEFNPTFRYFQRQRIKLCRGVTKPRPKHHMPPPRQPRRPASRHKRKRDLSTVDEEVPKRSGIDIIGPPAATTKRLKTVGNETEFFKGPTAKAPYIFNYEKIYDVDANVMKLKPKEKRRCPIRERLKACVEHEVENVEEKAKRCCLEGLHMPEYENFNADLQHNYESGHLAGVTRQFDGAVRAHWKDMVNTCMQESLAKHKRDEFYRETYEKLNPLRLKYNEAYYDPDDKKLMAQMLKDALSFMSKNQKYVLASLPDADKIPVLRSYMYDRFGKVLSQEERTKEYVKAMRVYQALQRTALEIPVYTPNEFIKYFMVPYTCSGYFKRMANEFRKQFHEKLNDILMQRTNLLWFLIRSFLLCAIGPPRTTFFAYQPARVRDILRYRVWMPTEFRDQKGYYNRRKLQEFRAQFLH